MYQAVLPIVATLLLAVVVFRWTAEEMEQEDHLSRSAGAAVAALVVLHGLIVVIAAAGGLLAFDLPGALRGAGGLLIAGGCAMTVGALVAMSDWRLVVAIRTDALITTGIYGRVRHPLYVGWTMLLLGVAVAGASLLAAGFVLLEAVVFWRLARGECVRMRRRFDADWDAYLQRTRGRPARQVTSAPEPR